jgi:hypothetical protein
MNQVLFRRSAALMFFGFLFYVLVSLFHVDGVNANDHPGSFALYAASSVWTAVHLGQFVGRALILIGLLCLFFALETRSTVAQFAAISAVVTLALYGVLQGVDGIALKQAVDGWVSAAEAEKAIRFANAESVRWLEWGVRSYESFTLGLTFILFAIVLARLASIPRAIIYLMGLSGLAYITQGWVVGSEGFSSHNTLPSLAGYILMLAWSLWLLVVAMREDLSRSRFEGVKSVPGQTHTA